MRFELGHESQFNLSLKEPREEEALNRASGGTVILKTTLTTRREPNALNIKGRK